MKTVRRVRSVPAESQASHRVGRRPITSRAELEQIALHLFAKNGFEETSADDVAAAAGVGRRTLFRYFASKNDIVWGEFDRELQRLRTWFEECPDDVPLMDAIRDGVLDFNTFPASVEASHRRRMVLILETPALQAHSTLRYAAWRAVISDFVARRLGLSRNHLLPRLFGHIALAAAVTAYEEWLEDPKANLATLIQQSFGALQSPSVVSDPTTGRDRWAAGRLSDN